jgi:hypothetical protein
MNTVMSKSSAARMDNTAVARTIRFPKALREQVRADAERCGRSFEAHVLAILRHHYGEDVDIAPAPDIVLQLARGSVEGLAAADLRAVTQRLTEKDR